MPFSGKARVTLCGCVIVCLIIPVLGCDLTHVEAPDVVTPNSLKTAAGANALRNGVISQFSVAYSDQILLSGLISDELTDANAVSQADQRIVPPGGSSISTNYPYDELSGARTNSLLAIAGLQQLASTPAWRIGELFAIRANVEVFFAEDMCSGVPVSVLQSGLPAYGPTLTRNQLIALALADFDSARKYSVGVDSILNLARVGTARAMLDSSLANASAAAVVADSVATGAAYATYYGSNTQNNDVASYITLQQAYSVSDSEGINGLSFVSAADPRLPPDMLAAGVYGIVADSSLSAPILLTTWIEARLVHAEASLASGDNAGWLTSLNALRADSADTHVPGLAPLADPGTPSARVSLMFRERAFWLFGTGHRQGDLRRLIRQYHREVEQVFPTGPYKGGPQSYGTAVAFVPFGETLNPNFHGCFDQLP
jgi:hypothetical protein